MESMDFYSEIRALRLELEQQHNELKLETAKLNQKVDSEFLKKSLNIGINKSIEKLLANLKDEKLDPIKLFKQSFGFLNEVEQHEFVARNMMESLKRGDAPSNLFKKFTDIGLVQNETSNKSDSDSIRKELMQFCHNFSFKKLKSLGVLGSRIVMKSLRRIPGLVKVKASLNLLPPFLSFGCELEDSVQFNTLLELIQDALHEVNSTMVIET